MSRPIAVSVFAVILLGVFALALTPVTAHDATPAARVEHLVVGAWWTTNDAPGPGATRPPSA